MQKNTDFSYKQYCVEESAMPLCSVDYPLFLLREELCSWGHDAPFFGDIEKVYEAALVALRGQSIFEDGLIHGGLNLFFESKDLVKEDIKIILLSQALKTLSDSSAKLEKMVLYDLRYLRGKKGPDSLRQKMLSYKKVDVLDRILDEMPVTLATVYVLRVLRSGIYCSVGEIAAAFCVLRGYVSFYETSITKNVEYFEKLVCLEQESYENIWCMLQKLKLAQISG